MSLVRVKNGTLRKGDKIKVMSTGGCTTPIAGHLHAEAVDRDVLNCGEVGWLVCAIKASSARRWAIP